MLFESTKVLLRNIVQSLEQGDDAAWDDRLESGKQCLYELHQMSRPSNRVQKSDGNSKSQPALPVAERAIRAIPHVKLMLSAMRRGDQAAALEGGQTAVIELTGMIPAHHPRPLIPEAPKPVPAVAEVARPRVPAKGPSLVPKRKVARASAAGAR